MGLQLPEDMQDAYITNSQLTAVMNNGQSIPFGHTMQAPDVASHVLYMASNAGRHGAQANLGIPAMRNAEGQTHEPIANAVQPLKGQGNLSHADRIELAATQIAASKSGLEHG